MNNLNLHLKKVGKEGQTKPQVSRTKEIIKTRVKINEVENRKTIEKINETKSLFFERVSKMDNPLARFRHKGEHKTNKIRNERGGIINDNTEIRWIVEKDYETLKPGMNIMRLSQ